MNQTSSSSQPPGDQPRGTVRALSWWQNFRPLAFDEPLESQFRQWYTKYVRSRIRGIMWIAMGCALIIALGEGPVRTLRETIFAPQHQNAVNIIRLAFMAPSAALMLLVTYTRLYTRWFARTAQLVAPLHAVCFIAADVMMRAPGYSLSAWMPIVVLSPYFLFGLLHTEAVRSVALIVLFYAIGGYWMGLGGGQRYFDLGVITFAGCMGAAIHYSLQKAVRHNYIVHQLLSESAHRDQLTGIYNRRMFDDHIDRLWQQATRERVPLSLLMVDIDNFKLFNDSNGHQAGDACLERVASVLARASRRPLDLTARYGGEEFAVLLYDARRDYAEEICRQLHASLAAFAIPHPASPISPHVTVSIGVACVDPKFGRRVEGFIQLADEALYAAKEAGRNRTIVMDREYGTLHTGSFRVRKPHDDLTS